MTPFSHPDYAKNSKRIKNTDSPCACCGKAVKDSVFQVRVYEGGGKYAATSDLYSTAPDGLPGDMYFYAVGTSCASRLVRSGVYVGRAP